MTWGILRTGVYGFRTPSFLTLGSVGETNLYPRYPWSPSGSKNGWVLWEPGLSCPKDLLSPGPCRRLEDPHKETGTHTKTPDIKEEV